MIQIQLDGKNIAVPKGSTLMYAAEQVGVYIPHFCYHKKLSIAANCRMCLVDVEKIPKPVPACATPVAPGMVVHTRSEKSLKAQQSVMEFLLINHPLDCPICDQGGECQLQDLAVGFGGDASKYENNKRVVLAKDIGPLISTQEMSRCIHCTRCIRFGQEIAGVMELGMPNRGEHAEIEVFIGATVTSELSGNMIDICPVGALTSKPFRYHARTWELSRRKSISPHDSTGANLILQVKNKKVMRVVPFENEKINDCWIADRDRFSYEALNNGDERLAWPMLKQDGLWTSVDWRTALEYIVEKLQVIKQRRGAKAIGMLASPHSTLEELALASSFMHQLGSQNVDFRLRHADFNNTAPDGAARWLGRTIASLSSLDRVLVIGSNLQKDHPLFAQRIRYSAHHGCQVNILDTQPQDWAMPLQETLLSDSSLWVHALGSIAQAIALRVNIPSPVMAEVTDSADKIAKSLLEEKNHKAILLGNAAAHHEKASSLLFLANWIGEKTNSSVGYLTEAANTVGAQVVGAIPGLGGLNAEQMLTGSLGALFLLNTEPEYDSAAGIASLVNTEFIVTLSAFKANLEVSHVLLPVAPFSETSGSFINAEGRLQSFYAAVPPLGETRPAWKVLRVLGNLLNLPGFDADSSENVLRRVLPNAQSGSFIESSRLSNISCIDKLDLVSAQKKPCTASIYSLDALVRRSDCLQKTQDAIGSRMQIQ